MHKLISPLLFLRCARVILLLLCSNMKTLGDSDDEGDSAAVWVMRSRQLEEDRRLAEQRVRLVFTICIMYRMHQKVAPKLANF